MSAAALIARDELRLMARNRVSVIAIALIVLLTLVAALTAWTHARSVADTRMREQRAAAAAFAAQPDRHPHRVVHYGHFIYRPLSPLAAFDPGIDAFTGSSMFLEGHRQNSANFGDARQSSALIRFGQLTPAFVLQAVAPLLLIVLGYAAIVRERERATLRPLLVQGASRGAIVCGKFGALGLVAVAIGMPAMIGFALIAGQPGAGVLPMLAIMIGYALYLALWTALVLLVSLLVARKRDALLILIAFWAVTVVLLPRVAPDLAAGVVRLPNRLETDVAIARDLRRLGDSHNPDDPTFAAFRQATLARYGAKTIEALPINYKGLLAMEGERITSQLFDRYAADSFAAQARQNAIVDAVGLLSPTIALRRLSMAAAGTDLASHRRFLEQTEAYRYALVQRLNRLEAESVTYADDTAEDPGADRRKRVDAAHWQAMPPFRFAAPSEPDLARGALPGLLVLAGWLAVAGAGVTLAARRLGRG